MLGGGGGGGGMVQSHSVGLPPHQVFLSVNETLAAFRCNTYDTSGYCVLLLHTSVQAGGLWPYVQRRFK